MRSSEQLVVELSGVTKSFSGVQVLKGVDLRLYAGRLTALAGENGAGKSTLIKTLSGALRPDGGTIRIGGRDPGSTPGEVIGSGISVIYQELTDVPDMTVRENLFLGRPHTRLGFITWRGADGEARRALARVGLEEIDLGQPIGSLSIAQRQLLEIARCLMREAKVLVFDEPTSALPESDVDTLMQVIGQLKREGLAILYVSHHLDELFDLAEEIVVLRDGKVVGSRPTEDWDYDSLVKSMLARALEQAYPWRPRTIGEPLLEVEGLTGHRIKGTSLDARRGEIVGLVGLAGAGRTELMRAIAGVDRPDSGRIGVGGHELPLGRMQAARRAGIVYVSEDRKREGVILDASVADNLILGNYGLVSTAGWLRLGRAAAKVDAWIRSFGVKTSSPQQPISGLSGGNQQKVVLARAAALQPQVILLDDPTRGVDVGSKSAIYDQIFALAEDGCAVLVTSSDTDEVLAVSDRSLVVRAGRVVGEIQREDYDRERILHLAAAG